MDISRTGYTGDLGYEIWVPWNDAVKVWDALMDKGKQFDIHAAGMLALDVARVEAGLLLIEVDYTSSKKALIASQKYSPYELGFGKMVHLEKENFIGKAALAQQQKNGVPRQLVGLEIDWTEVEERYEKFGLTPAAPSQASRVAVPVYLGDKQVGKATTTTWSPVLKKMIALASVDTAHSQARHQAADGDHDRSHAAEGDGKDREDAVLQSGAEDGDAGLANPVSHGDTEARRKNSSFVFPLCLCASVVTRDVVPLLLVFFPPNKSSAPISTSTPDTSHDLEHRQRLVGFIWLRNQRQHESSRSWSASPDRRNQFATGLPPGTRITSGPAGSRCSLIIAANK